MWSKLKSVAENWLVTRILVELVVSSVSYQLAMVLCFYGKPVQRNRMLMQMICR